MGITDAELEEAAWSAVAMGGAPVRMFYLEALKERQARKADGQLLSVVGRRVVRRTGISAGISLSFPLGSGFGIRVSGGLHYTPDPQYAEPRHEAGSKLPEDDGDRSGGGEWGSNPPGTC